MIGTQYIPDTESSEEEEEEEEKQKKRTIDCIYSGIQHSVEGYDAVERHDFYTNIARDMRFEKELILSGAVAEFKTYMEVLKNKPSYKILCREVSDQSQDTGQNPEFIKVLNFFHTDLFPPQKNLSGGEKLMKEKKEKYQREVDEEKEYDAARMEKWRKEADSLFEEISRDGVDEEDKWQYKKGLRLAFLGTKTGNVEYKEKGLEFYHFICKEKYSH